MINMVIKSGPFTWWLNLWPQWLIIEILVPVVVVCWVLLSIQLFSTGKLLSSHKEITGNQLFLRLLIFGITCINAFLLISFIQYFTACSIISNQWSVLDDTSLERLQLLHISCVKMALCIHSSPAVLVILFFRCTHPQRRQVYNLRSNKYFFARACPASHTLIISNTGPLT